MTIKDQNQATLQLLNTLSDGVICINKDCEVTFINEAAKRLTGCEPPNECFRIMTLFEGSILENGQVALPAQLPFNYVLQNGKAKENIIIGLLTEAKKREWLHVSARPLYIEGPNDPYHTLIELKPLHVSISAQKAPVQFTLHSLLNNTEEGYIILNPDFEIEYFNSKAFGFFKQLFVHELEVGNFLVSYTTPHNESTLIRLLKNSLVSKKKEVLRNFSADGTASVFLLKTSPLYNKEEIEGVMVNIREITTEFNLHEQLTASNDRMELAIKVSKDIVWEGIADDHGIIHLTFPLQFTELTGFTNKEIDTIEALCQKVIHPEDLHLVLQELNKFEKNSSSTIEIPVHRFVAKNGNTSYVIMRAQAFRGKDNKFTRLVGVTTDVTQNHLLHDSLIKSNERFELAARASYDLIWDVDMATNQLTFSDAIIHLFGYDVPKPMLAMDFINLLVHPDDKEELLETSRDFIKSKKIQREFPVHRVIRKNGTIAYVMVRVLAIRNSDNYLTRMIGVSRDITDTYLADQAIRKSHARFALASRASFDVIWERDFTTNAYYFSEALKTVFGYDNKEEWSFDKVQRTLIHPDDREPIVNYVEALFKEKKEIFHYPPFRYIRKNGEIAYVQVHAIALYDESGKPLRAIGVTRDITTQYLLQRQVHKANQQYELVAKATSDVVWEWNYKTDELSFANDAIETLFGYRLNESITMKWRFKKIHPEDQKRNYLKLRRGFKNKQTVISCQYRFLDADNNYRHILDRAYITYSASGDPQKITGAMQDITAINELQEQLAHDAIVHQQKITEITIQTQEEEREEFGRELHDNINQILASVKLYLEMAIADKSDSKSILQKSHDNINKVIGEIRMLSRALISPVLDIGLADAVRELINNINIPGAPIFKFVCDDSWLKNIPHTMQLMIYRIVQEQVNNIIKHAHASEATITIYLSNKKLLLEITDNGVGFESSNKSSGVGLRNIKSRVALYEGKAKIISSPGHGCTLNIEILVPDNK